MSFKGFRISSDYGYRTHPITKKRSFHGGVDLVKAHRSPIKPFIHGRVITASFNNGGFGNLVIVRESNGYTHYYAHLDVISTKVGDTVSINDTIGLQGATGRVTGSHLHYEVRNSKGERINPIAYINSKGVGRVVKKISVDGLRGRETIDRWQQFLGVHRDGIISNPSNTILKWQKFLNWYTRAGLKEDGIEGRKTIEAQKNFFGKNNATESTKALQRMLNNFGQ